MTDIIVFTIVVVVCAAIGGSYVANMKFWRPVEPELPPEREVIHPYPRTPLFDQEKN